METCSDTPHGPSKSLESLYKNGSVCCKFCSKLPMATSLCIQHKRHEPTMQVIVTVA